MKPGKLPSPLQPDTPMAGSTDLPIASAGVPIDSDLVQHEVVGGAPYRFELERRDFFKLLGAGLVVGVAINTGAAQESGAQRRSGDNMPDDIAPWIHIGASGDVTVYTGKVEMGQNIRTSLAQQVADELRVAMPSINLLMGDTDLTPFDMGTFGSRTTPQMGTQLRKISALARETLIEMAIQRWGASAGHARVTAQDGAVRDAASGKVVRYGELTRGQKLVKILGDADPPELMPPGAWQVAGKPVGKVAGRDFVTGRHQYTSDIVRPGMLHAKVLRAPAFRSTLASLDDAEAKKLPGVTVVRDGNFAGVAASDLPTAERALKSLVAKWDTEPQIAESALFDYLKKYPERAGGPAAYRTGDVEKGRASADKTLDQTYTVAYIQHAPLEPRAAVAEWNQGKLTVWTGSQRPFAVKDELLQAFRLSPDKVRVIVPDTGSAYGGKHTGEAAVEAARLAKAAGKPVKLLWTREEEFTWAYFRPAGVIEVRSAVISDGTVVAWEFDNYNSGPAAIRPWYSFPNQRVEYHGTQAPPLRQGSYRGLAATANHFARESHMDELAHLLGIDPLALRLKNIADPRLRAVLEAAADRFGWARRKPTPELGFGIACGFEKGGYQATCAELAIERGVPRVTRVVCAWDSGPVINPNGLRNQVLGAIVQGIGGALFEAVHFDRGRVANPHFADYRVPRFADSPEIDVVLIDRKDVAPFGAGETPIVGIAPAAAEAIFVSTGRRLRAMPLAPGGLQAG